MKKFFNIEGDNTLYLYLKVKTGDTENSINSPPDHIYSMDNKEYLKINIKSPPVDGKANKMIIAFLSELLKIPKSKIDITNGHRSKFKCITIKNSDISITKEKLLRATQAHHD